MSPESTPDQYDHTTIMINVKQIDTKSILINIIITITINVKQTRPSWCFLQDIRGVGFPVASQLPKTFIMMVINHEVLLYHDHRDDEIVDDDHDFHGDDGHEYEYESPISIRDPSHDEGCGMARQRNA